MFDFSIYRILGDLKIIPLIITGLIPVIMSITGIYTYQKSIPKYLETWKYDPAGFVQAEKDRVEGYDKIFRYSYPSAIILVVGGVILFFLVLSPNWKAICLSLMLIGIIILKSNYHRFWIYC